MAVLAAAASAAGFDWTAPAGVDAVAVIHPAGARATIGPPASGAAGPSPAATMPAAMPARRRWPSSSAPNAAAIRRGDAVMLIYQSGGVTLSMRTQAMQDAHIGQSVRLMNLSSNRVVLGLVTGPGAASASP